MEKGNLRMKWREAAVMTLELGGLASTAYGCWLWWPPSAFIVAGIAILAGGVFADLRSEGNSDGTP
jgi:hypothetical protein